MIQDTRLSKILKYKIFKYYSQVKIFKILFMCTQFFIKIRIFDLKKWFEKNWTEKDFKIIKILLLWIINDHVNNI